MRILRCTFALCIGVLAIVGVCAPALAQSDWTAKAVERAASLQHGAESTLERADARVRAAESDSAAAKSAVSTASGSGSKQALSVAQEAEAVAQEGLQLAHRLQANARAFLNERQRALRLLRAQLEGREPRPHALLLSEKGDVRRLGADGSAIAQDAPLAAGQRVDTGAGGRATLYVAQGQGEISLGESSSLAVSKDDEDGFMADLDKGIARFNARLRAKFLKRFEVRTPTAVCAVRGTEYSVRSLPEATEVQVFSGTVSVVPAAGGQAVDVPAGHMITVGRNGEAVGPVPLPTPVKTQQGGT